MAKQNCPYCHAGWNWSNARRLQFYKSGVAIIVCNKCKKKFYVMGKEEKIFIK